MKKTLLIYCLAFLCFGNPLFAQSDTAALEQKLKDMEERIISLEGQVRQLKSQGATPGGPAVAPPATTEPQASVPSSAGEPAITPSLGGASNAGKALNPDISVIGDFLGAVGKNPFSPGPSLELH